MQGSLHCASQKQGRDAPVEMTEIGLGRSGKSKAEADSRRE